MHSETLGRHRHAQHWDFFRRWVRNPRRVAAVAPSSRRLAARMVDEVPAGTTRVIELGPGTGVMTEALLARGLAPEGLLAVELDPALHDTLRARFPALHLVRGDARHLDELATGFAGPGEVDAVISSLGLLGMDEADRGAILSVAFALLRPDGRFIQFTYGVKSPVSRAQLHALGLRMRRGAFILRNLPPATVYVYTRAPAAH
ncbi:MAG TPA: methyltransferase domain-containing protein [Luteimonas sp.]|nr:methyltransferase domain-containing protein [Luteimonas sp.]